MKAKITQELVNRIQPTRERYRITDEGRGAIPGFHLRVSTTGEGVFYLSYWTHAREKRNYKIGSTRTWTVGSARLEAEQVRLAAKQGQDPHRSRTEAKQAAVTDATRTVRAFVEGVYRQLEIPKLKTGEHVLNRVRFLCADAGIMDKDLASLKTVDLERWRNKRLQAGTAQTTLNRDVTAIRSMVKSAVRLGLIETNPLQDFKNLKVSDDHRVRYLEPSERERLSAALDGYHTYLRPLVGFLLNTGLRRGEAFTLLWSDVDLERRQITIRGVNAKSGKARRVPLNKTATGILEEWLGSRKAHGLVFPSPATGEPLKSIARQWEKLTGEAGLTDFRLHDCRHDFASQLVMKGVDLYTVRDLLGHASILMTERYAHLAPEHQRSAVEVLDNG